MAKSGGYIEVTVLFFKEGDQWTAQCVELGTATCADTLEEAETAIEDMVHLHLDALGDVGERQKFLKAHGVTLHRGSVDRTPRRKTDVRLRAGELAGRKRIVFPKLQPPKRRAMVM